MKKIRNHRVNLFQLKGQGSSHQGILGEADKEQVTVYKSETPDSKKVSQHLGSVWKRKVIRLLTSCKLAELDLSQAHAQVRP